MPARIRTKTLVLLSLAGLGLALLGVVGWLMMIRMPGKSSRGTAAPLSAEELTLRQELMTHVQKLGGEIGERNMARYPRLLEAAEYIESQLSTAGWKVRRDSYEVQGKSCHNLEVELPGASPEIVLIGAHYDSVFGSPGANDNGSGVAALLALARRFAGSQNVRTLRFVAFVNEEPHYFQTSEMGSFVYAGRCRERNDPIKAMLSLETIGYYSKEKGSQNYPAPGTWSYSIRAPETSSALSPTWLQRRSCARHWESFGGMPRSLPPAERCPPPFPASAGRINGPSGSMVIPGS